MSRLKQRYTAFMSALDYSPLANSSRTKKLCAFMHFLTLHIKEGLYMEDYLQYGFYNKTKEEREEFLDARHLRWLISRFNNPEYRYLLDHKAEFCRLFADFVDRDVLDTQHCTSEQFSAFCERNKQFFKKPEEGMFGKGAGVVCVDDHTNLAELLERLKAEGALVESIIPQHHATAQYNPTSLNCARVVTIALDDTILIPAAVMRFGRAGRKADNFHHGGLACKVDPEKGIIISQGVDKQGRHYTDHPDSGLPILGFQLPLWNEVRQCVSEAAKKLLPNLRYVGWDVAITPKGPRLVEGNYGPDPDVLQMPSGEGMKKHFERLIGEEIKGN